MISLAVYSNFAVSRTVLEKFDVKQSNDLEISRESCRVTMCVKRSEDSERKKRKSPFSTTPISISPAKPRKYLHKPYTARNCILQLKVYALLCQYPNNFVWKPEYAKPLDAEPKTDFNAK